MLNLYPHQLSGGMRQRVAIALATVFHPSLIIADEPTTALDVVVQRGVLQMLKDIQAESGNTVLLVTHDLAVHANVADRVAIMYAGRIVEEAPTQTIFNAPLHPYTQHLIRSLPMIGDKSSKSSLGGSPPNLANPPAGCRFHPRCPLVMDVCRTEVPEMIKLIGNHRVACHLVTEARPMNVNSTGKLLDVQHVMVSFHIGGFLGGTRLVAVNDISFSLDSDRPEIFTLAGESGSGKTTLARLLLHDLDPTTGKVLFEGRDLATISSRNDAMGFMKKVQPVFQNPFETFSPLRRVEEYLFDTAVNFGMAQRRRMLRRSWTRHCTRSGCRWTR